MKTDSIHRGDAETRSEKKRKHLFSAPLRLRGEKLPGGSWLPDMDLNHDKQIQSLLCYRYTIGQAGAPYKLVSSLKESRCVTPLNRCRVTSSRTRRPRV